MISSFIDWVKSIREKSSLLAMITANSYVSKLAKVRRFAKIYDSQEGDYSYVGPHSWLINTQLGKFCSISSSCNIGLGNHTLNNVTTSLILTDKNNYFFAADLVVFSGTHSVLWEQAVSCGIPCILKYWEGMTHLDVGGNVAYLHHDSVSEIKEVIKSIVGTPNILSEMKQAALDRGVNRFSYSNISKRAIS